eukprot:2267905-Amphidinium_carterae.3
MVLGCITIATADRARAWLRLLAVTQPPQWIEQNACWLAYPFRSLACGMGVKVYITSLCPMLPSLSFIACQRLPC